MTASPVEPALSLSNGDGTTCSPARQCRVIKANEVSPEVTDIAELSLRPSNVRGKGLPKKTHSDPQTSAGYVLNRARSIAYPKRTPDIDGRIPS